MQKHNTEPTHRSPQINHRSIHTLYENRRHLTEPVPEISLSRHDSQDSLTFSEIPLSQESLDANDTGNTSETKRKIIIESWTDEKEELLIKWKTALIEKYDIHNEISIKRKGSYEKENFVSVITPLILTLIQGIFTYIQVTDISNTTSNITSVYKDPVTNTTHVYTTKSKDTYEPLYNLINIFSYAMLTIIAYIIKNRDNGSKSANSNQHAIRCIDVVTRIELELSKSRNYRSVADTFMLDIRNIITQLQTNETFIIRE